MIKKILASILGVALFVSLLTSLTGCQTVSPAWDTNRIDSKACEEAVKKSSRQNGLDVLNQILPLYKNQCWNEVILLGSWVRNTHRDKNYSLTEEFTSLFVKEEFVHNYTLESYERTFLSLLIASSYKNLGKKDEAFVELNRTYNEIQAQIYNHGVDPLNLILAAVMFENMDLQEQARPFWQKSLEFYPKGSPSADFVQAQLERIDAGKKTEQPWYVLAIGRFPVPDWKLSMQQVNSSYYRIFPRTQFSPSCSAKNSAYINAEPWFEKIKMKYSSQYHPLLNAKSWLRLPLGVVMGVGNAMAGTGILVSGCAADVYLSSQVAGHSRLDKDSAGPGSLCKVSAELGISMIEHTDDVFEGFAGPDLRYWSQIPMGFEIHSGTPDPKQEGCTSSAPDPERDIFRIF